MQNDKSPSGVLYIVATPIGNLEDITLRALRILKEVDYIAAEDTRHTKKLLNHYDIHTRLIAYYREEENKRAEKILSLLKQGNDIALVSDAGTPCIADPGAVIVEKARENQVKTVPIPGASALTTALSCAGIAEGSIMFYGFVPAKKNQRRELLQTLTHVDFYSVFYESPHRLSGFLKDTEELLGNRQLFIGRELTKNYEELKITNAATMLEDLTEQKPRGEYVVIIAPAEATPAKDLNIDELIIWYRDNSSLSLKDCCKRLSGDLGISRSKLYKRALQIW